MIRKFILALIACTSIVVTSCKNDDNSSSTDTYVDIPLDERYTLDDEAIEQYLTQYYFNPISGRLNAKDTIVGTNPTTGVNDDDYVTLNNLAQKDAKGYWYVINPEVTAEGPSITSNTNDSILISYEVHRFRASSDTSLKYKFLPISTYLSSLLTGSGTPKYDPYFYHVALTETQTEAGLKPEYYILENFVDGLKHFKSTETDGISQIKLQGAIILPSKLAYGRNMAFESSSSYVSDQAQRDYSFIISFELHKILPREE